MKPSQVTIDNETGAELPRRFTPERIESVLTHLKMGAGLHSALRASGIPTSTFHAWKDHPHPEVQDFVSTCYQHIGDATARAERAVFYQQPLAWLTKGPGRASAENPAGWSEQVAITGPDGGPVQVQEVKAKDLNWDLLTEDETRVYIELTERLTADRASLSSGGPRAAPLGLESGEDKPSAP